MAKTDSKINVIVGVVLAVFLIGLAGWYVWQKGSARDSAANSSSDASHSIAPLNSPETKPTDLTEGGTYVYIKEWGVRFPVPEEFRGKVQYGIRKNVQLNEPPGNQNKEVVGDIAYLTSDELASEPSSTCTINAETDYWGGPVAISRSTEKPSPFSEAQGKYIEGVWYRGMKGNGGVCYKGSSGQVESDFINAILGSIKRLEVI